VLTADRFNTHAQFSRRIQYGRAFGHLIPSAGRLKDNRMFH
jgi:hypothetical protein